MAISKAKRIQHVVENHLNAFRAGDIDALMEDYAEDAVFFTSDDVLRGRSEIRPLFDSFLEAFPPGSTLNIEHQEMDGELAFLVWSGESDSLSIHFATDTLIVRDGKISRQTFAAQTEEKASS